MRSVDRIICLALTATLIFAIPFGLISSLIKHQPIDLVYVFVAAIFWPLACICFWYLLNFRHKSGQQIEAELALSIPEQPHISEHERSYRFQNGLLPAAVAIDEEQQVIHFFNCHAPRRMFATSQPRFCCPLSDLLGIYLVSYPQGAFTVVTQQGKASIPSGYDGFLELRERLTSLVPRNAPRFAEDQPLMGMVYLGGACCGLLAGYVMTPDNANDSTLGLLMIMGAILGPIISHVLIVVVDRKWRIGLVQPFGFAVAGAINGLLLCRLIEICWAGQADHFASYIVLFGLLGLAIGGVKQYRDQVRFGQVFCPLTCGSLLHQVKTQPREP